MTTEAVQIGLAAGSEDTLVVPAELLTQRLRFSTIVVYLWVAYLSKQMERSIRVIDVVYHAPMAANTVVKAFRQLEYAGLVNVTSETPLEVALP